MPPWWPKSWKRVFPRKKQGYIQGKSQERRAFACFGTMYPCLLGGVLHSCITEAKLKSSRRCIIITNACKSNSCSSNKQPAWCWTSSYPPLNQNDQRKLIRIIGYIFSPGCGRFSRVVVVVVVVVDFCFESLRTNTKHMHNLWIIILFTSPMPT